MELADHLDRLSRVLPKLSLSEQTRFELHSLSQFLRAQALSDFDRRASQKEITEAATEFVRALYQASLQASLQQPQDFWDQLERFANKKLEIKIRPRNSAPVGSEKWDAKELFTHLISECSKLPTSSDRAQCLNALEELLLETSKVRFHRNTKLNKELWRKQIFPFVQKQNLMQPFRQNEVLRSRLEFFLKGTF